MVMDIGWVGASLSTIRPGKLGPGPLQPDSQPISALPHKARYQVDQLGKGGGRGGGEGTGKGWQGLEGGHTVKGGKRWCSFCKSHIFRVPSGTPEFPSPRSAGNVADYEFGVDAQVGRGGAGGGGADKDKEEGVQFCPHIHKAGFQFDVVVRVQEGGGGSRRGLWVGAGEGGGGQGLEWGRGVQ